MSYLRIAQLKGVERPLFINNVHSSGGPICCTWIFSNLDMLAIWRAFSLVNRSFLFFVTSLFDNDLACVQNPELKKCQKKGVSEWMSALFNLGGYLVWTIEVTGSFLRKKSFIHTFHKHKQNLAQLHNLMVRSTVCYKLDCWSTN